MYDREKIVEFPSHSIEVRRESPIQIPIKINRPKTVSKLIEITSNPIKEMGVETLQKATIDQNRYSFLEYIDVGVRDDFETGDNPFGLKNMVRTRELSKTGAYSARTKSITHRQTITETIKLSLKSKMRLSFDYTVSSEKGWDHFRGFLNGQSIFSISGTVSWSTFTRELDKGNYELKFTYSKDGSVSRGLDGGFIDNLSLNFVSGVKYLIESGGVALTYTDKWEEAGEIENIEQTGMNSLKHIPLDAYKELGKEINIVYLAYRTMPLFIKAKEHLPFRYTIELLDNVIQGWSQEVDSNQQVDVLVFSSDLYQTNRADLQVNLEIGGNIYTESIELFINSHPPDVSIDVKGLNVKVTIDDQDQDLVKYKIMINKKNIFPLAAGFSEYMEPPIYYDKTITSRDINIGSSNEISVISKDYHGKVGESHVTFEGKYVGLMFSDENGEYYSTDLGQVLMYLQMRPKMMAGSSTLIEKIRLTNTYEFPVTNIRLSSSRNLADSSILFSKTKTPFTANKELNFFEVTLNNDEYIDFFVRVSSTHKARSGGEFNIIVDAEGV